MFFFWNLATFGRTQNIKKSYQTSRYMKVCLRFFFFIYKTKVSYPDNVWTRRGIEKNPTFVDLYQQVSNYVNPSF